MVEQNSWLKKKVVRPLKQGKKARPSNNMGDNSVLTPCLKGTELSLATSLHLNKSRAFKKASQSRDKRVLEPTAGGARQRRDYKQQVLCSASEGQARGGQKGKPGAE